MLSLSSSALQAASVAVHPAAASSLRCFYSRSRCNSWKWRRCSRSRCSRSTLGAHKKQKMKVVAMASEKEETAGNGVLEKAAIAGGLVSTPIILWSLYTLKTTGCGLPPGPGGSIGALEGISYLVVVGIVGWSLYTKSKTGSGLPNGPFGLLGAVEGLSYLSLLAIILVFGFQFLDKGSLPGPLPGDDCFG